MTAPTYDVVIVGGGIVGLILACGLRRTGRRIAVVEAQSPSQVANRPRAYALSPRSARIFQALGVWKAMASAITHFRRVILSDGDSPHQVEFTPADVGEPAIYHCAEHAVVVAALQQVVVAAETITCWYETRVQAVTYGVEAAEVVLENAQGRWPISTQLVVAADGVRSPLRQRAGIKTDGWDYWQSCITAVVAPAQPHQAIAYERFWPSGPFAVLPLPQNRCQVVWIAPHAEAQAIAALPPTEFIATIQVRYGDHAGDLCLLTSPLVFPARLMHSRRYVQPRLVLVGDAAHVCHPVGGQGLNMGIRDAAWLAQVLQNAQSKDLGDLNVLQPYGRRHLENWAVLLVTDLLNRTFSNTWWPLVRLRRGVLRLMIAWALLRRLLLRFMVGDWGTPPLGSLPVAILADDEPAAVTVARGGSGFSDARSDARRGSH